MSLGALEWKWGQGCASARFDDETGKVVITKWHRKDMAEPDRAAIDQAVAEFVAAGRPGPAQGTDILDAFLKDAERRAAAGESLHADLEAILEKREAARS